MKRWIDFLTAHRFLVLLLVGLLFVLSLFFVKDLNIEAFPDPSPPMIEVVTIYEGKSAEEVEKRITLPIEIGLASMRGMERLDSISLYGLSDVKCKFSYDLPYLAARQEVINRLSNITLPDGVQATIVPSPMGEVMQYVLQGSGDLMELRTLQDWTVGRYLKTAQGVEDVASYGGFIKAYVVKVLPENLVKYGVTLNDVLEALSKSNMNVGGRTVEMGDQYYMVRGLGLIRTVKDIEENGVAVRNGKPVLIQNVAQVSLGNVPRTGIVIHDHDDDAVMGNVILRRGEKSIPSIRSIHEKIEELNSRVLPAGIKVVPYYERWDLILKVIRKVLENATLGIALVALALLLFLGNLRAALVTAAVIPVSLAITLGLMAIRGESANLLSIGAIDFGIIADIGLVLVENYVRISRQGGAGRAGGTAGGEDRTLTQAIREVGRPILLLVLIVVLAFIPIFTMKGAEKQIFSPMARTYALALLITLGLTFTYLPAGIQAFVEGHEGRELRLFESVRGAYLRLARALLERQRLFLGVVSLAVLAGFLLCFRVIGTQFLPNMDEGNIYVRITFPYSISLSKTYENAKLVRDALMRFPEAKTVAVRVGRPEDGTDATGPFNSEYYVDLVPRGQWRAHRTKPELEEAMRTVVTGQFPNASVNFSQYMQDNLEEVTSGVKGENAVKVFGDDLQELDRLAKEAKRRLEGTPGIEDVGIYNELGQPNFLIEVDRKNTAAVGLKVEDVLDMVSAALGGKQVSQVIEGDRSFALLVSFPYDFRTNPEKIAGMPILLDDGGIVPLSRVARIRYDVGASFIYRENHRRYIPVKFSVAAKDLGGTVRKAQRAMAQMKLPEGYYLEWSGIFKAMLDAFRRFYISIPLALGLILVLLYVFYGNVRNVLLTAIAPVCTVFGGLVSLVVTRAPLSISAVVGFVSVIGISTFNTSILITHYQEVCRAGQDRQAAILGIFSDKFRSILMVGLVASLGLLPASLAQGVGSQVQKPLAIVVVGGMLVGTALILVVMPLVFRFIRMEK